MTKKDRTTYGALLGVLVILVVIGTLSKSTVATISYNDNTYELPALTGDPVLTAAELPELIAIPELPEILGVALTTVDDLPELFIAELPELLGNPVLTAGDLPHLTLPPLEG